MMNNDMLIGIAIGVGGYLLWDRYIKPGMAKKAGNGGNGFLAASAGAGGGSPWSSAEQRELEDLLKQADVGIEDVPVSPSELGPA